MKYIVYIVLLLLLPFLSIAQEQNINNPVKKENTNFKNQIDSDVEVLAISLGYKRRFSKNWLIGISAGIGPQGSIVKVWRKNSQKNFGIAITELTHLGLILKKELKSSKWSFEIEPRLGVVPVEGGFYTLSLGVGMYYGRKLQVGFKISGGRLYRYNEYPFYAAGNVILKIPLKRW